MANFKLTQTGEEIQEILDKVEDITASAGDINTAAGEGGTEGQFLQKTEEGVGWVTVPSANGESF